MLTGYIIAFSFYGAAYKTLRKITLSEPILTRTALGRERRDGCYFRICIFKEQQLPK